MPTRRILHTMATPQAVPATGVNQPATLLSRGLGPYPNLDPKPLLLSSGLNVVLRPPPSLPPISWSKKS